MEWWIIGALVVVVVILIAIYLRSLRESKGLANLVLLILLDQKIHATQSKGLADLVRGIDAKNAGELGGKVYVATCELAESLSAWSRPGRRIRWQRGPGRLSASPRPCRALRDQHPPQPAASRLPFARRLLAQPPRAEQSGSCNRFGRIDIALEILFGVGFEELRWLRLRSRWGCVAPFIGRHGEA
jgi:hypothetical protein